MTGPVESARCEDCGAEFLYLGGELAPSQCEDCARRGAVVERIAANVRELREGAALDQGELAALADLQKTSLSGLERGVNGEPGLLRALRLVGSLGLSIDKLVAGVYWYPGDVGNGRSQRPPTALSGFFSVLPPRFPPFELLCPDPERIDRADATVILGQTIRELRERRHLTLLELAGGAGLSKDGLLKIELGRTETTIARVLDLARGLQVPPALLLDGLAWAPSSPPSPTEGRAHHRRESLDAAVVKLWNEDLSAPQIADALDASPGSIAAIVLRLRERGEPLEYRAEPLTRHQDEARKRRAAAVSSRMLRGDFEPGEPLSKEEIAGCIAANIRRLRQRAELTPGQLAEAIEEPRQRGYELERRALPQLGLVVRLAASLNVPCSAVTTGVAWQPGAGWRRSPVEALPLKMDEMLVRLGANLQEARRRVGVSQAALGKSAELARSDVAVLESGRRPLRFFAFVRVAGALSLGFREMFAGISGWYELPLPAPEIAPGDPPPAKTQRDAEVVALWRAGRSEAEIASKLDLSVASIGPYIRELRDAGLRLPYRRPPRSLIEVEARVRRRRQLDGSNP